MGILRLFLVVFSSAAWAAGGQDLKTVWNVFGETDRWISTFAPYVRAGDTILIVEGNGGSLAYPPNAIEKLRKISAALKPLKGKIRFGVYTSDLENVKTVAKGVKSSGFAFIAYGYEPSYGREFPREGDKGWQFEAALENVRRAKAYAKAAGKKLMLVSTGRPLLEEELQRYKWDYSRFFTGAGADELLIQTQTWIRRWDFREALDVLDAQLNGRERLRERVILQVTVEPRREANQNGVAAVAGYDATIEARLRGYRTMSMWHAWRDPASALEYLSMIGRAGPRAVPTFECAGLYWSPPQGAPGVTCAVSYRAKGESGWKEGLPLWHDARFGEYRGSVVGLKAGTTYEVKLALVGRKKEETSMEVRTWTGEFPVAATVFVPSGVGRETLTVSRSGSPEGWVLYTGEPGGKAIIDVDGKQDACVVVDASFVIIRGLDLRNAARHGLVINEKVHDVVIEGCDISGWGRVTSDGFGEDNDGGIWSHSRELSRVVIQRNRIHDPRANSNDWCQKRVITHESYHPAGPQAVVFWNNLGNHVIRFNEVWGDESHRYNDGMGGGENFSVRGFPGADTDVYGNTVRNVTDDALEIEGSGRNIRVWGNYMDTTFTGVASAACSIGPLYIFRNVMDRSRECTQKDSDADDRGWFEKIGDEKLYSHGRRYIFHNTLLQRPAPGKKYPLGAHAGPSPCGGEETMSNTVSLNNIWNVHKDGEYFCEDETRSKTNLLDYDLSNGRLKAYAGAEPHGFKGFPTYLPGNGDEAGDSGLYQLAPGSPGFDGGVRIPGFNDDFKGNGPDIGAHESGAPAMVFGVGGR